MWDQLRHSLRRLGRSPLFSAVALVTLGVGIGANSAIFSIVNGVLLKPLPYDEPERLVGVWHTAPGIGFGDLNQSPALHFHYREEGRVFEDIGMWATGAASVTGLAEPERVETLRVTAGILPILRVHPVLGRAFTAEDDAPGSPLPVMLTYDYWQRRFGGDPGVIGRTLIADGLPREIIGVTPGTSAFCERGRTCSLPCVSTAARCSSGTSRIRRWRASSRVSRSSRPLPTWRA